ncbi:MAG TPA: hypothetical protein VK357_13535 [Rubrobacteraceae bacterium]|nr:hypothetical protein [Rubrobacteraceae bacterium]
MSRIDHRPRKGTGTTTFLRSSLTRCKPEPTIDKAREQAERPGMRSGAGTRAPTPANQDAGRDFCYDGAGEPDDPCDVP